MLASKKAALLTWHRLPNYSGCPLDSVWQGRKLANIVTQVRNTIKMSTGMHAQQLNWLWMQKMSDVIREKNGWGQGVVSSKSRPLRWLRFKIGTSRSSFHLVSSLSSLLMKRGEISWVLWRTQSTNTGNVHMSFYNSVSFRLLCSWVHFLMSHREGPHSSELIVWTMSQRTHWS